MATDNKENESMTIRACLGPTIDSYLYFNNK